MNGQVLEENPTAFKWEDEATDKTLIKHILVASVKMKYFCLS